MKVLLIENVRGHIMTIFTRFQIAGAINNKLIEELVNKFRKASSRISYDDMEKGIACIYVLREFGIPLKGTAECLGMNTGTLFDMLGDLKQPSFIYIDKFIDFLTRFESEEYKDRFQKSFADLKKKYPDQFILATALNSMLKKENDKSFLMNQNTFGYSMVALRQYRKKIREDSNGN